MSIAFEITPEDVSGALQSIGMVIDESKAEELFDEHILLESGRIEDAALHGSDMDSQLAYAHAEILAILREENAI